MSKLKFLTKYTGIFFFCLVISACFSAWEGQDWGFAINGGGSGWLADLPPNVERDQLRFVTTFTPANGGSPIIVEGIGGAGLGGTVPPGTYYVTIRIYLPCGALFTTGTAVPNPVTMGSGNNNIQIALDRPDETYGSFSISVGELTLPDGATFYAISFETTFALTNDGQPAFIVKNGLSGTVPLGTYYVTVRAFFAGAPFAQGKAVENPFTIGLGDNSIPVLLSPIESGEPHGNFEIDLGDSFPPPNSVLLGDLDFVITFMPTPENGGEAAAIVRSELSGAVPPGTYDVTVSAFLAGTLYASGGANPVIINRGANDPIKVSLKVEPGFYGNGTKENPFRVFNAATLQKVGQGNNGWTLDVYYRLMSNIVLTETWTPIGTGTHPFTGTFDGNGFSITGLTINNPNADNQGLFGVIGTGGRVKNLVLIDVNITGGNLVGGIAGTNNGTIENLGLVDVYITSLANGNNARTGGIAGQNNGTVENSFVLRGTVGGHHNTGGLVGFNTHTVQNSVALNTSLIFTQNNNIGRVAGSSSDGLSNNFARADMGIGNVIVIPDQNGLHGVDVGMEVARTVEFWTARTPNGPGWTVYDNRDEAIEAMQDDEDASPWWWCDKENRPRLRFE